MNRANGENGQDERQEVWHRQLCPQGVGHFPGVRYARESGPQHRHSLWSGLDESFLRTHSAIEVSLVWRRRLFRHSSTG